MVLSKTSFAATAAGLLALTPAVLAGFDASSQNNVAVYWGQNSAGTSTSQQRLSAYCDNDEINIINLSFLNGISTMSVNFANAGDNCTAIDGTSLLSCPQIEEDIVSCQAAGKTIILSIGGATYSEGGFTSTSDAEAAAQSVWALFGSDTTTENRPFGDAVVDGFDFDFESATSNMLPFAQELRSLMDADSSKTYYLSAAPQCPYPDAADNDMLTGDVSFDFLQIQFYNNYCSVASFVSGSTTQNNFNFDTWNTWATTISANTGAKLLVGIPASTTAAGSGYVEASSLSPIVEFCQDYSSFGGLMMWDMSQLYSNSGFLDAAYAALPTGSTGSGSGSTTTTKAASTSTAAATSTATTAATTAATSGSNSPGAATTLQTSVVSATTTASSSSSTGVAQWGQCGGSGYSGSTTCASGLTCTVVSTWWSQCE